MIPVKNDGHYYRCTSTTSFTSSISEPVVWSASKAYVLGDIVRPSSYNGHYYRCTTAGTRGATQPAWPTTSGGIVVDGSVTWTEAWTEAGTIMAKSTAAGSSNDAVLDDNIYNHLTTTLGSRYGTGYTVVTTGTNRTRFIKFSGISEDSSDITTADEKNILKVTIKSYDSAETL